MSTAWRDQIYRAIDLERDRQDVKRGLKIPSDFVMASVLGEECGEVMRALNDGFDGELNEQNLRNELIQVAAVCVRWLELRDWGLTPQKKG
jgi:NTP pyrophosphatase (non-canonical NTP hydrolase)